MWDLPKIFLRLALVSLIRRSLKPPNQGALLGMNFYTTPCALRDVASVLDCRSLVISSAADENVNALALILYINLCSDICCNAGNGISTYIGKFCGDLSS